MKCITVIVQAGNLYDALRQPIPIGEPAGDSIWRNVASSVMAAARRRMGDFSSFDFVREEI